MELRQLEKVFKTAIGRSSVQPTLAALGGDGKAGIELPSEFAAAVKTLSGRSGKGPGKGKILADQSEMWL